MFKIQFSVSKIKKKKGNSYMIRKKEERKERKKVFPLIIPYIKKEI